jgi:hypothetical protein
MEGLVELVEKRHAALGRGASLLGSLWEGMSEYLAQRFARIRGRELSRAAEVEIKEADRAGRKQEKGRTTLELV